ncbi:FkbM family methyltransferase [Candidatus Gracilibacteria bacterium]|jgi:FkbM family methyltransferase|nr:FkbM family methyltransferase [Candidatus Gracilibacteria bacterium]
MVKITQMNQRYDLLLIQEACKEFNIQPKNIFEIGSRDGLDTNWLSQLFNIPPQNCFVFEPHPTSYKNIISNFPKFNIFNIALWDETETITFNAIRNEKNNIGMSSLMARDNLNPELYDIIDVDAWRMDNVLNNISYVREIDICKIDVEGATFEVLCGFGTRLNDVLILQLEIENKEIWKEQKLFTDINNFLTKENDFYLFGQFRLCDEQSDCLYINKKLTNHV